MSITASIVARHRVEPETIESMLALHVCSFDGVRRERFMADLAGKDWVILLRNEDGTLAGFSTQGCFAATVDGRPLRVLFSGDTVVDRRHWNTPFLAGCFGHLMLKLVDERGEEDQYWLLISKGFRTYRFLPVFFNRFWPSTDWDTPPEAAKLREAVAQHRFGDAYDPCTGIVHLAEGDRLMPDLARVPPVRLRDRHVVFFLKCNPGYACGDELVCLAPIRRDNLNAYAHRVIRATTPEWRC